MKQHYNYEKQLHIGGGFNLWQHNFERWPFSKMMEKAIARTVENVKQYVPLKNLSMEKLSYQTSSKTLLPFYKISPEGSANEKLPVILYYHGGGFIYPLEIMMLNNACYYARQLHCHVLLPEYRLAPKHSCKTVLGDCYAMLDHANKHAAELSLDMKQLILLGDSAGGALAAGVALLSRDNGGPKALLQMLIYPVTDRELDCYPSMNTLKYAEWTKSASRHMWHLYLRHGDCGMLPYVAPMQNPSHADLPPAYIEPQEFDTLRDQAIAYGKKLKENGIPVKINLVKGTCHGFDNDVNNPYVKQILNQRCQVMQQFLRA